MALDRGPDLDTLSLLLEIAEVGSLSKAGAARGLSQPAVSARMRGLERLVGFPVLARSARGSRLTPEGALLAEWARAVLAAAGVLGAGIRSLRDDRAARLRVAASLTVAEHLLPGWLVVLASTHPDTAVSLTAGNSADVAAAVLAGDADLGFVEGPDLPAGLSARAGATDRLVVVVNPGHPGPGAGSRSRRRSWPVPDWSSASPAPGHEPPWSGPWRPAVHWHIRYWSCRPAPLTDQRSWQAPGRPCCPTSRSATTSTLVA